MKGSSDPVLSPDLLDRVLQKLGLDEPPTNDLPGLNTLYAAFCAAVPDDNIQKRIWFASDQTTPVTGGDPAVFFENWLAHGTGGTCWPISGALCTLLRSLGFDARRLAGRIELAGPGTNHGSVITALDGIDYVVDGQIAAFEALPVHPRASSTTGDDVHNVTVEPRGAGFDLVFYPAVKRDIRFKFCTEPEYYPVDHTFFLDGYERSKASSPFNDVLYVCRRFPRSILTLYRHLRIEVGAGSTVTQSEVSDDERKRILIEEVGISEQAAETLPPDVPGGGTL